MNIRTLFTSKSPTLFITSLAVGIGVIVAACSSSTTPPDNTTSCTSGTTVACTCADGRSGTAVCGSQECTCASASDDGGGTAQDSAAPGADTGSEPDANGPHNGDGGHVDDGAAPISLYGACAVTGSFGWPCTASATGPDPTDCTDPNYPDCFVGGQGSWCTKSCKVATDCTADAEDAGCVPTACNAKLSCK
jgi:hypothetical protein